MIHATAPSTVHLPEGDWPTALDSLCACFPRIPRGQWLDRVRRGRVLDARDQPIDEHTPYGAGMKLRYFREVASEPTIPGDEVVLHEDAHLVVVDKPHFLPVVPAGAYVQQTLLARLVRRLGNPALVPLHRLDRETAGLVLFSAQPATRDAYLRLFRERRIAKRYEALAAPLPGLDFPYVRHSRLERGEPFFRMREADGEANSETRVDVIERGPRWWRYALDPHTGRKHQLRVHMAALGAPIRNDRFYPALQDREEDDPGRPLQLLARALAFVDPLSGRPRQFRSARSLDAIA
ncbi:pseudouridine synthase [Frateuria hangzhouensis]|uniref:pseudouridine synthase n=1 Tax=Frateuria hangzhouensis TaxID=2995589 RepID=UPI002260CD54|nr:pseudouridine synthase [Frateuria sp. STR12]MCX7514108.1 pseudouridine synthase [Frateuria sp. STR12]